MTFGGTFGAGQSMTPIGVLATPRGALQYNPDAVSVDLVITGTQQVVPAPQVDNLRFTAVIDQTAVLGPFIALGDGASTDRGTLSTAFPQVNEHGIPHNFGPGSGNWTQSDLERFRAHILYYQTGALLNANIGQAVIQPPLLVAGDISMVFRNISLSNCSGIVIDIEYRHTINLS